MGDEPSINHQGTMGSRDPGTQGRQDEGVPAPPSIPGTPGPPVSSSDEAPEPRDNPADPLPPLCGLLRWLLFMLVVRPMGLIVLGLNVRHRERLPLDGPALIVANHNSHLDALVLMILWPQGRLRKVRPVAAADYFYRFRALQWFALRIIGIIPINRELKDMRVDPLARISQSLERGEIVILFPEGRRGEPERLEEFKTGVAHLARRHRDVPVHPVFMHGLGKALPRGEALLVPFFCDIFVGEALRWSGAKESYMADLNSRMKSLADEGHFPPWD